MKAPLSQVVFLILALLLALPSGAFAEMERGHGGGRSGARGGRGGNAPSIFPRYPTRARPAGPGPSVHGHVDVHPDPIGNRVTEDHLHRVDVARGRADQVMRNDVRVTNVVSTGRAHFTRLYRPEYVHRDAVIGGYISHYNTIVVEHPVYLDVWRRHHFYGGFYWGFHPVVEIDTYFYNPMVYWFFVPTYDEYYYRNWYKDSFDAYPELHHSFDYHGVYYPTENLRQLLFGVSAMTVEKQARFRDAIEIFTRRLAQNMANGLGVHVTLSSGDIVLTHYEIVGYDDAVQVDGVVSFRGAPYNFKGLVDIENPEQSDVFVPATWDKNPNSEQLSKLDALNAKIAAIKGEPAGENVSAEPQEPQPAPAPGQVSAEPEHK